MSKIIYLLGAGASANAIPVVKEFSNQIKTAISELIKFCDGLKENASENKRYKLFASELIADLEWLQKECKNHATVDTLAKKLYVTKNNEELYKLKMLISIYFSILQVKNPIDPRYDNFLASIMGESFHDLSKDISVISWNYDNQFELAFRNYSSDKYMETQEDFLGVVHKYHHHKYRKDKFKIFKINGTSGLYSYGNGEKHNILDKANYQLDEYFFKEAILKNYLKVQEYSKNEDYKPLLSFAWENENDDSILIKVQENLIDCINLVIIGYSVPFFNRKIDKFIFDNLGNVRKIYIQDKNPDRGKYLTSY